MQHTLQDQCMCTDQYGMLHLGLQRMENTKLITNINLLLVGTIISSSKVVPLIALPLANHLLPHLLAILVSHLSNIPLCNGSKIITWSMTIAMTLREITLSLQSARVNCSWVKTFMKNLQFTCIDCIGSQKMSELDHVLVKVSFLFIVKYFVCLYVTRGGFICDGPTVVSVVCKSSWTSKHYPTQRLECFCCLCDL